MDDNKIMTPDPQLQPPVSLELLEEYTGGDRDFLKELTDQFWLDLEERLPRLRDSVAPFHGPTIKSVAHAIAGSATCVGAETLREKALALEVCGRDSLVGQAPGILAEFEAELERVRLFFDDYLAG